MRRTGWSLGQLKPAGEPLPLMERAGARPRSLASMGDQASRHPSRAASARALPRAQMARDRARPRPPTAWARAAHSQKAARSQALDAGSFYPPFSRSHSRSISSDARPTSNFGGLRVSSSRQGGVRRSNREKWRRRRFKGGGGGGQSWRNPTKHHPRRCSSVFATACTTCAALATRGKDAKHLENFHKGPGPSTRNADSRFTHPTGSTSTRPPPFPAPHRSVALESCPRKPCATAS